MSKLKQETEKEMITSLMVKEINQLRTEYAEFRSLLTLTYDAIEQAEVKHNLVKQRMSEIDKLLTKYTI